MAWLDAKDVIVQATVLERDALHVHLAVAAQLLAAWMFRWRLSSWKPVLVVLLLELGNEVIDLNAEHWPDRALQYSGSIHDIVNTLVMPIVLLLVARRTAQPGVAGPAVPTGNTPVSNPSDCR